MFDQILGAGGGGTLIQTPPFHPHDASVILFLLTIIELKRYHNQILAKSNDPLSNQAFSHFYLNILFLYHRILQISYSYCVSHLKKNRLV